MFSLRAALNTIRRASFTTSTKSESCFHLLGLPETFSLDSAEVSARFKTLQAQWHPDKFANSPEQEQLAAADMSARINAAHDVVTRPHRRAQHLLSLRDPSFSLDEVRPPSQFLAWVMMFRGEVEDAAGNPKELASLREQLHERRKAVLSSLDSAFHDGNMSEAALETAKLQYLHSIASVIDDVPP